MKKIIAMLLSLSIFISGCASTVAVPVPIAQVGDETKSCSAITNEMQQMITAQIEADGNRNKQIGVNSALAVAGAFLLVPWFFMDLGGAASAEQKAAKARYDRLQQMLVEKRCPTTPFINEQPLNGQNNMNSVGNVGNIPANSSGVAPLSQSKGNEESQNLVQKLESLNNMLKKGLINQDEYNAKKNQILNSM